MEIEEESENQIQFEQKILENNCQEKEKQIDDLQLEIIQIDWSMEKQSFKRKNTEQMPFQNQNQYQNNHNLTASHKTQGLKLLKCNECQAQNRDRYAQYINVSGFLVGKRYLCSGCKNKELYTIAINTQNGRKQTQFGKNVIINSQVPQRVNYYKHIEKLLKKQIRKLEEFSKLYAQFYTKWHKQLTCQSEAILGTFEQNSLANAITMLCEPEKYRNEEIAKVIKRLALTGKRQLNNINGLASIVKDCCEHSEIAIDKQVKNAKQRLSNLDHHFKKYRLTRIYDKNKQRQTNQIISRKINNKEINKNRNKVIEISQQQDTNKIDYETSHSKEKLILNAELEQYQKNINAKNQISVNHCYVQVNYDNYRTIWAQLSERYAQITHIFIKFDPSFASTLTNISLCCNLQEIILQQSSFATRDVLIFIINNFPNLKKLALNCYNQFDDKCAELIMQKLPQIKQVYWGCNFYNSIAKIDENRNFRQHPKKKRYSSLNIQILKTMIKKLQNLQNLWIDELNNILITELITQKLKLKYLTLGKYDSQQYLKIDKKSWQQLSTLNNLHSLAFIKIEIQESYLSKMLINSSSNLKSLYFYDCRKMTDFTCQTLKQYCHSLRQLFMYRSCEVEMTGQKIWQLKQLNTLILRQCEHINVHLAEQNIKNLNQLTHLSLVGNYWVSDVIVQKLILLKNLYCLCLGHTNVTMLSNSTIASLPKLKCLNVGSTRIKGNYIVQMITCCPFLRKLNLWGLKGSDVISGRGVINNRQIYQIGSALPNLTHLDVGGCDQLDDSIFTYFPKLQFVGLYLATSISEQKKYYLKQQNIIVIDEL